MLEWGSEWSEISQNSFSLSLSFRFPFAPTQTNPICSLAHPLLSNCWTWLQSILILLSSVLYYCWFCCERLPSPRHTLANFCFYLHSLSSSLFHFRLTSKTIQLKVAAHDDLEDSIALDWMGTRQEPTLFSDNRSSKFVFRADQPALSQSELALSSAHSRSFLLLYPDGLL